MIGRTHRFHGYNSLNWAYRRGRVIRDAKASLYYALNPKRNSYRAAVVVSRKVSKSAVVRNRIRRRIYEVIREAEPEIKKNYDLIFSVYSDSIAELPYLELKQFIVNQLRQARVVEADQTHSQARPR